MELIMYILVTMIMTPHQVSYYGDRFQGKQMANGEIFDKNKLTCAADKSIPLNTILEITNIENNKKVIVRVTDRGSFKKYKRTIDLSEMAFTKIGTKKKGILKCRIKIEKIITSNKKY